MASSIPTGNYEEELRKAQETLINFDAFTEKARLDPEKYPKLEQDMHTYISILTEITHKARNGQNNCREYLIACNPSLLRPTPGRDKDERNFGPIDSGISSGIIAEETRDAEEKKRYKSGGQYKGIERMMLHLPVEFVVTSYMTITAVKYFVDHIQLVLDGSLENIYMKE